MPELKVLQMTMHGYQARNKLFNDAYLSLSTKVSVIIVPINLDRFASFFPPNLYVYYKFSRISLLSR